MGWSLWLPPALISNPIWFREKQVEGSTEALMMGCCCQNDPFLPPSCSLPDMPFIILLLMQCFFPQSSVGQDRRAHPEQIGKESVSGREEEGCLQDFPGPCSPGLQTEEARLPDWESKKERCSPHPPPTPDSSLFTSVGFHGSLFSSLPCFLSELLRDSGSFLQRPKG